VGPVDTRIVYLERSVGSVDIRIIYPKSWEFVDRRIIYLARCVGSVERRTNPTRRGLRGLWI
jgi:hypothetical protein